MSAQRRRIFRLLETADNFLKYARPESAARAADRARRRYEEAAALAESAGDADMLRQARLRLDDLDRRSVPVDDAGSRSRGGTDVVGPAPAQTPPALVSATGRAFPRVPPGQRVMAGWPVLHEGPIPGRPAAWRLTVAGACRIPLALGLDELRTLPRVDVRSDFHCVTGWSKLDNLWTGVRTRDVLERAGPLPEAAYVLAEAPHGYDANVPLETLLQDDAVLAWAHDGRSLAPEHGGPLRLVVPRLYGWKSVKWVQSLRLLAADRRGFWELRGYHNRADPWREERYSYQE